MFVDPSGYLREPGSNRNGEWSDNPDRDDYGEGSKIYVALCRLTEAYEVFPEYHSAIADLANELRWIGNEWGSSIIDKEVAEILKIEQAKSLNTVEQVLVAAYKREAIAVQVARVTSDMFTKMIYNEDGNGTNEANAFKHIYWSAYTTSEIGGTYTKLFLNAHEFGWYEQNLNNPEAMKMDLHNNQRGRYLGSLDSRKDLLSIVLNDIANGNAAILVNGKSVLNGR